MPTVLFTAPYMIPFLERFRPVFDHYGVDLLVPAEVEERMEEADLLRYASAVGIDPRHFVSELRHAVHASRVREDFMGGVRSGVNGTPTFFINGMRHDGPWDEISLVMALEAASGAGRSSAGATGGAGPRSSKA